MLANNTLSKSNEPGAQRGEETDAWTQPTATGGLIFADGSQLPGLGLGATGAAIGEVCFNTAMTGYQEILTDPSYTGQIITFTFPHIGNIGTNDEDSETANPAAGTGLRGAVFRANPTQASNYRALGALSDWLKARDIVALAGIDTRALTARIREHGLAHAAIVHAPDGNLDIAANAREAAQWPGLTGMDLARDVTCRQTYTWDQTRWQWGEGYGRQDKPHVHVVVMDFGIKSNILRCLASAGCRLTIVPADTKAADILAYKPDGVFLSNGPGDPAATGLYVVPELQQLLKTDIPIFGICLGHQMLALALGAQTEKMHQGHHGANHPVKDHTTGKVEITSMNHGFTVDAKTLPAGITETHVSLFDGTNCGIAVDGKPVFSVQHHPEASPGPRDSHYLFERFVGLMETG